MTRHAPRLAPVFAILAAGIPVAARALARAVAALERRRAVPRRELLPLGGKARSAKGAPKSPLARDIVLVLVIKAVVLGVLWFAFFRAPAARQMAMDPQRVEQQVVAPRPNPELPHAVR